MPSSSSFSRRWDLLLCRTFGHRFVAGPRYHNAHTRGTSRICNRCAHYESIIEQPPAPTVMGKEPVTTI